jgi:hypothetical protein
MDVAEIAIRIGETMIDRAWVAAGEQFWIGEMPGTSWPSRASEPFRS